MTKKEIKWVEKVKEHYDNDADNWIIDVNKEPKQYYYTSYFKSLFKNNLSGIALDIGCGTGTFTFELCKYRFKKIYALDISEGMLLNLKKEIKKRKVKNINVIRGDVQNLPFKNNSIDFIISVGLMECFADQKKILKEIYRVLKPGGTVCIRWLNDEGLWGKIEYIKRKLGIPSGPFSSNFSKIEDAISQIKKAGFKINSINGMIVMPLFIFPSPFSNSLELFFVKTKLAYLIESTCKNKISKIRRFYYSFCTELSK